MKVRTCLTRQAIGIVVVIGLTYAVRPIGANAAAFFNMFITDPSDTSRVAHVDRDGNLQVTGNLGINGTPSFQLTGTPSVQLVPANPLSPRGTAQTNGDTGVGAHLFDVPSGQRMIVEFMSVFVSVEAGLTPDCLLETEGRAFEGYHFPVFPQKASGSSWHFIGGLQTRIYAGEGGIRMECATGVFSDHSFINA